MQSSRVVRAFSIVYSPPPSVNSIHMSLTRHYSSFPTYVTMRLGTGSRTEPTPGSRLNKINSPSKQVPAAPRPLRPAGIEA